MVKALLPPSRRQEDDSDDSDEISEKTKKTKKTKEKVNTFNEDFVETIDEDEKSEEKQIITKTFFRKKRKKDH